MYYKTKAKLALTRNKCYDATKYLERINSDEISSIEPKLQIDIIKCYLKIDEPSKIENILEVLMSHQSLTDPLKFSLCNTLIKHDYFISIEELISQINDQLIKQIATVKYLFATQQYKLCIELISQLKQRPGLTDPWFRMIIECEFEHLNAEENWSALRVCAQQALTRLPDDWMIISVLLKTYKKEHLYSEYQALIEQAFLKFGFTHKRLVLMYSRNLMLKGKRKEALTLLQDAFDQNNDFLLPLIKQYIKEGQAQSVIDLVSNATLDSKDLIETYGHLLRIYVQKGLYNIVPAVIDQIVDHQPDGKVNNTKLKLLNIALIQLYHILTCPDLDIKSIVSIEEQEQLIKYLRDKSPWLNSQDLLEEHISTLSDKYNFFKDIIKSYQKFMIKHNAQKTIHSYENPSGALKTAEYLKHRIDHKIPTSFIRLGDGEGIFMKYPENLEKHQQKDQNKIQFTWWKGVLLTEEHSDVIDQFHDAVINADVLGIVPERRIIRSVNPANLNSDSRGILAILHNLPILPLVCELYTSCHAHTDLEQWDLYSYILKDLQSVVIISCHIQIAQYIKERFGIDHVTVYNIPSEKRYEDLFGYDEIKQAHFPDVYYDILDRIKSIEKGQTVLVAAGFLGKVYCDLIKRHGGIALDIGSVADRWSEFATRGVDELGKPISGGLWFKHSDTGSLELPRHNTVRSNYNYDRQLTVKDTTNTSKVPCDYLITGHPRTGTYYTSTVFRKLGFAIGHEGIDKDGMSSWLHAAYDLNTPSMRVKSVLKANQSRYLMTLKHLLLLVRHPKDAIPSIILENLGKLSYRYRRFHILNSSGIDIHDGTTAVERAALSYINWIKMIELQQPDFILKLEHIEDDVQRFLTKNDIPFELDTHDVYTEDKNSSVTMTGVQKPTLTKTDYLKLSPSIRDDLYEFCGKYQYSTDFLG